MLQFGENGKSLAGNVANIRARSSSSINIANHPHMPPPLLLFLNAFAEGKMKKAPPEGAPFPLIYHSIISA